MTAELRDAIARLLGALLTLSGVVGGALAFLRLVLALAADARRSGGPPS